MIMVFVPVARTDLATLERTGELLSRTGFCDGLALRRQVLATSAEEADYAAFGHASIDAVRLTGHTGERLVVSAEVDVSTLAGTDLDPLGRVRVGRIARRDVTAVFVDEPGAAEAVRGAAAALAGLDLPDLIGRIEVDDLLASHDLLWHLPSEVAHEASRWI